MVLPRMRSPRGSTKRRVALWSALAIGTILPSVGCQVEYAGMTLPSGRYMHDDVQYFPSGSRLPLGEFAGGDAASPDASDGYRAPRGGHGSCAARLHRPDPESVRDQGGIIGNPNVQPRRHAAGCPSSAARSGRRRACAAGSAGSRSAPAACAGDVPRPAGTIHSNSGGSIAGNSRRDQNHHDEIGGATGAGDLVVLF